MLDDIKSEPGIAVVAIDDGAKYQDLGAMSSDDIKRGIENQWPTVNRNSIAGNNTLVAFVLPIDSDEYSAPNLARAAVQVNHERGANRVRLPGDDLILPNSYPLDRSAFSKAGRGC